jgi:nitrate reductase delta subunit
MNQTYEDLARLFEYPGPEYRNAAAKFPEFARTIDGLTTEQLQESFIQAFDLNPGAALEIGWHLFGENYQRGEFLVMMRGQLKRFGVPESTELPDHLTHVLRLLARMDEDECTAFSRAFLLPALEKMTAALTGAGMPFLSLLTAVEQTALAGVAHE